MTYFHYEAYKTMLTVKEVSDVLNVSVSTVYRIINTGEIKGTKISKKCIRVKGEELKDYIDKQ